MAAVYFGEPQGACSVDGVFITNYKTSLEKRSIDRLLALIC